MQDGEDSHTSPHWIPAFAGMTMLVDKGFTPIPRFREGRL